MNTRYNIAPISSTSSLSSTRKYLLSPLHPKISPHQPPRRLNSTPAWTPHPLTLSSIISTAVSYSAPNISTRPFFFTLYTIPIRNPLFHIHSILQSTYTAPIRNPPYPHSSPIIPPPCILYMNNENRYAVVGLDVVGLHVVGLDVVGFAVCRLHDYTVPTIQFTRYTGPSTLYPVH